jgi:hypothetical protein
MSRVSDFLNGLEPLQQPYRCPDCNADSGPGIPATHDDTCWVGNGIEAACDADRGWFDDHPAAESYVRAVTAAELAEFRMLDPKAANITHVRVSQIMPGVRARQPIGGAA